MEKKRTYGYIIRCKHCQYKKPVQIQQGVTPDVFGTEYDETCPRCKGEPPDWEPVEPL